MPGDSNNFGLLFERDAQLVCQVLSNASCGFNAVHFRHAVVCQNQLVGAAIVIRIFDLIQGLLPRDTKVDCFININTLLKQEVFHDRKAELLVIDHQYSVFLLNLDDFSLLLFLVLEEFEVFQILDTLDLLARVVGNLGLRYWAYNTEVLSGVNSETEAESRPFLIHRTKRDLAIKFLNDHLANNKA